MIGPVFTVKQDLLDRTYAELDQMSNVQQVMTKLAAGLRSLRNEMSPSEWTVFTKRCIAHPLVKLIHQDPFTFRTFSKPRGYAGDALMLDYIYRETSVQETLSKASVLGREIYKHTSTTPASRAVRERRDVVARMIDEVADEVDRPRILSIACGHLNEAKQATSVQEGCIDKFIAFDQDTKSLVVVEETFANIAGVTPLVGSVRQLLKQQVDLGKFDFIYALGLYDYLSQPIARRLTGIMFELLRPGGRLLVGNFLPDIQNVGYMETFMDWSLLYRNHDEMADLGMDIDEQGSAKRIFTESNENIIFLEIRKQ